MRKACGAAFAPRCCICHAMHHDDMPCCLFQDLPPAQETIDDDFENFPLYGGPRKISSAKKADLLDLCQHLPVEKRDYYEALHASGDMYDSGGELELEGPVVVADVVQNVD